MTRALLGALVMMALGTLKAALVRPVVWITESDGALAAAAMAVEALMSCVGCSSGWMDSGGASGAGATRLWPGSSKSVCGADDCTSTTLPKVSTKMKCSATLIVKKRERPNATDERAERAAAGIEKRKSGHRGKPSVV